MARKVRLFIDIIPATQHRKSGVGFSLLQLLKAIDQDEVLIQKYEIIAFTTIDNYSRAKSLHLKSISLRVLPIPTKILNGLFKFKLLFPIDLILGSGVYLFYNFRRLPLTNKSPSIVCVHDLTYLKYPEFLESKNLAFLSKFVPESVRSASKVITVSNAVNDDLAKAYPESAQKMVTLYNTIGPEFTKSSDDEVRRVSEKYGLPADKYVLYIGNKEPRKNIETLVDAFSKFDPKKAPPLVLVGAISWSSDKLDAKLDELKAKGFRIVQPREYVKDEDIPAILSNALCTVTPSVYEGFSYPPLQSILCDTPAIISEGLPVTEVSDSFITIKYNDSNELARQIKGIMEKGLSSSPQVDRESLFQTIGYRATAKKLDDIIEDVVGV